jgi:hypothetical protein
MAGDIPEYLVRMVRRPVPAESVIPVTTPVVAFGDPRRADVATLGINPSLHEFLWAGRLLTGPKRRLSTLESLGAESTTALTEDQVETVITECAAYFLRNTYRRWFDPLDQVLRDGLGASYYDTNACHLDLVQWATAPAWGKLPPGVRQTLLEESLPHLRDQLEFGNVGLVVLNGREVLKYVMRIGLAKLEKTGVLRLRALTCSLYSGAGEGVRFLGWSTNLQSSFGVSHDFRVQLAHWLAGVAELSESRTEGQKPMPRPEDAFDAHGYVMKGTSLASKADLLRLLQVWLERSNAPKIGNAKRGQTPCISITLGQQRMGVINADTKRAAVEQYVKDAQARGADIPWSVIQNCRTHRWNKLVFREDHEPTPGWYCYLKPPSVGPAEVK